MLFIEYPQCSTCQKAKKWLDAQGIDYTDRNIKQDRPTITELTDWHERSGIDLKRLFNTSGMVYRARGLKDKLPTMTDEEKIAELASDGMLVKRPLVIDGDTVLAGFREAEWAQAFGITKA